MTNEILGLSLTFYKHLFMLKLASDLVFYEVNVRNSMPMGFGSIPASMETERRHS